MEGEDERKKAKAADSGVNQARMHIIQEKRVRKHVGNRIIAERQANKRQDGIRYTGTWHIRGDKEGNHGARTFMKKVYVTDRPFTDEEMMMGYETRNLSKAGPMKKDEKKGASSGVLHTCEHCEKYARDESNEARRSHLSGREARSGIRM